MSKFEGGKRVIGEDSGNGRLLHEVETISKALYSDNNHVSNKVLKNVQNTSSYNAPRSVPKPHLAETKSKSKGVVNNGDSLSQKEKKSFWNWKPLKALSLVRNKRFTCCFSLTVHSVESLQSSFNAVSLRVHWKRRDGEMVTHPSKVFQGVAEFEEKLTHTCSVYGSRSGPHHSAKYEAKHFLLYVSILGMPEVDLGKHRVDLTRLLPLTLEELEEEKSTGNWTTSFKLSGKGKGATMQVSFGYSVLGDSPPVPAVIPGATGMNQNNLNKVKSGVKLAQGDGRSTIRRGGSLPTTNDKWSIPSSRSVEDIKVLHDVLPFKHSDLSKSVDLLYKKLDQVAMEASIIHKPEHNVFKERVDLLKPSSGRTSDCGEENVLKECETHKFLEAEQGTESPNGEVFIKEELPFKLQYKLDKEKVECVDESGAEVVGADEMESGTQLPVEEDSELFPQEKKLSVKAHNSDRDLCTKESIMKELESALNTVSNLEEAAMDSPEDKVDMEFGLNHEFSWKGKSVSYDDASDSVATEFLNMLGIEHSPFGMSSESEPESPRERLLRQFEKDTLGCGFSLFDLDSGEEDAMNLPPSDPELWRDFSDDVDLSSAVEAAEEEYLAAFQSNSETTGDKREDLESESSTTNAKKLEDLETESLMREWGLNEKAFEASPSSSPRNPINPPSEVPVELPSLGEGLGPYFQTKNGGFLRSMNPTLFSTAKEGGNLIMQVSSPVVVPAEMGSGVMEILQGLASVGMEKLSMQANKLMPLDDITGKTMQQIAWEAAPSLEAPESQFTTHHESAAGQNVYDVQNRSKGRSSERRAYSSAAGKKVESEYVSLEDLAPLAMDKIEALSIEGLKIQSGVSDNDAPSNISVQPVGDHAAIGGRAVNISGSFGNEGTAGIQLLDVNDNGDDVDGLMGLSLTLDEWMRLDSGDFDDEDQISERTSKVLAAHHANSLEFIRGGSRGDRRRGKGSGRKCGLLGNNFTVALLVQLRDPLRNYEPVGTPMLALVQVERVFVLPKPKIYCTVPHIQSFKEEDDETELVVKQETKEEVNDNKSSEDEGVPEFKITEVHVAGLKTDPAKKKLWGNKTQQQSGSRWLVANGMGKNTKHPLMKSKTVGKSNAPSPTSQANEALWSVSSNGRAASEKKSMERNPPKRNPNIIFPTIKLF